MLYSFLLTCFAGLMSGLTVGYNGLNQIEMNAIEDSEILPTDENYDKMVRDKKMVKNIKKVLRKKHLLLVTLLLANAVAMEALPIFLDSIMPAIAAIILSTTAVLIFGEVLPQVAGNSRPFAWAPTSSRSAPSWRRSSAC